MSSFLLNDPSPISRRPVFRLGPLYPHVVADIVMGGGGGGGGLCRSASAPGGSSSAASGGRDYCVVKEYDSGPTLWGRPR